MVESFGSTRHEGFIPPAPGGEVVVGVMMAVGDLIIETERDDESGVVTEVFVSNTPAADCEGDSEKEGSRILEIAVAGEGAALDFDPAVVADNWEYVSRVIILQLVSTIPDRGSGEIVLPVPTEVSI